MADADRRSRAEGEPASTRDHLSPDEDARLLPETDEVRVVVSRNESGPVEETVVPVDEWLRRECSHAAARVVLPTVERRLDASTDRVGVGVRFDGASGPAVVVTCGAGDGWVKPDTSPASFEELVAVAPRTVRATVGFEDRERTCEVPVFVERSGKAKRL